MRVHALLPMVLSLTLPTVAADKADVTMPTNVDVEGKNLVLNGMGLREVGWIDVYVAGLYLENKSSDGDAIARSDQTRQIKMEFVRGVSRKKLVKAWKEGFKANSGPDLDGLEGDIDQFNSWMSDVEKGDTITLTYRPGRGTEVQMKVDVVGTIEGEDFARGLFLIWLGSNPPTTDLRDGMLGLESSRE